MDWPDATPVAATPIAGIRPDTDAIAICSWPLWLILTALTPLMGSAVVIDHGPSPDAANINASWARVTHVPLAKAQVYT